MKNILLVKMKNGKLIKTKKVGFNHIFNQEINWALI